MIKEEEHHIVFIKEILDTLKRGSLNQLQISKNHEIETTNFFDERAKSEFLQERLYESMVPDITVFSIPWLIDKDLRESYEKMIDAVSQAEVFLEQNASLQIAQNFEHSECDMQRIVKVLSEAKGYDVSLNINQTPLANYYASQDNLREFASRGVLTPEHIIRTKRVPLIMEDTDLERGVRMYMKDYENYFKSCRTKRT